MIFTTSEMEAYYLMMKNEGVLNTNDDSQILETVDKFLLLAEKIKIERQSLIRINLSQLGTVG